MAESVRSEVALNEEQQDELEAGARNCPQKLSTAARSVQLVLSLHVLYSVYTITRSFRFELLFIYDYCVPRIQRVP